MARQIDLDQLMKYPLRRGSEHCDEKNADPRFLNGVESILEWAQTLPTLTPPNEWVSVEERLPTDERPVLVFVGYADTMTGFITTSSYFCFDANPHWQWDGLVRDEQRTLFWMPLPAPPGEDNNVPTNKPLTLERVAKEFLVICGNDCVGDPSVGIPPCPFFQFKDVEDNGAIIDPKCELAAYRRPPEGEEDNND